MAGLDWFAVHCTGATGGYALPVINLGKLFLLLLMVPRSRELLLLFSEQFASFVVVWEKWISFYCANCVQRGLVTGVGSSRLLELRGAFCSAVKSAELEVIEGCVDLMAGLLCTGRGQATPAVSS